VTRDRARASTLTPSGSVTAPCDGRRALNHRGRPGRELPSDDRSRAFDRQRHRQAFELRLLRMRGGQRDTQRRVRVEHVGVMIVCGR